MIGGWFPGGGARLSAGGGRWGPLPDLAAALGAKIGRSARLGGLRCLAGDAGPLVVHGGTAVEVLADLDSGAGVGAAPWSGRDRDGPARQSGDVVLAYAAPVAEAEDVRRAFAGGPAPVGGTRLCGRLAEARVVPRKESGERGVGLY